MKYVIYGEKQYTEDFLYLFPTLEILCVLSSEEEPQGRDYLNSVDWSNTRLLLCDQSSNRAHYRQIFETYACETHVEWTDDYLHRLNRDYLIELSNGKELLFWGAGNTYRSFQKGYSGLDSYLHVDREPQDESVRRPEEIVDWGRYFVIITSIYQNEIIWELENHGVTDRNYISCFDIWESPRDAFLAMQDAKKYPNVNCRDPFKVRNIDEEGRLTYCICSSWIRQTGNLRRTTFAKLEEGIISRLIRLSVLNQTYYFCRKGAGECALFDRELYPDFDKQSLEAARLSEPKPEKKHLLLRTDASCNLKCESCRDRYITSPTNGKRAEELKEIIRTQVLSLCDEAAIASYGEIFFSKHYREIVSMDEFARNVKTLFILTNGILFTEDQWRWLRSVYRNEVQVSVSIDAATEETYRKLRGGDFQKLLDSLRFISALRKKDEITFWGINFVIQRANYREIPEFIRLGTELGVDTIYFGHLDNWGTYAKDEYRERTMFDLNAPRRPNEEFQRFMEQCVTLSDKINWNNLWTNFRIRR